MTREADAYFNPARDDPGTDEPRVDGRAWRSCMMCGERLWSTSAGHRHCDRCRRQRLDDATML